MIHTDRKGEELWIYSMGKRFQVRAITTTTEEANSFMEHNADTALIACFGPFNVIAEKNGGAR